MIFRYYNDTPVSQRYQIPSGAQVRVLPVSALIFWLCSIATFIIVAVNTLHTVSATADQRWRKWLGIPGGDKLLVPSCSRYLAKNSLNGK